MLEHYQFCNVEIYVEQKTWLKSGKKPKYTHTHFIILAVEYHFKVKTHQSIYKSFKCNTVEGVQLVWKWSEGRRAGTDTPAQPSWHFHSSSHLIVFHEVIIANPLQTCNYCIFSPTSRTAEAPRLTPKVCNSRRLQQTCHVHTISK